MIAKSKRVTFPASGGGPLLEGVLHTPDSAQNPCGVLHFARNSEDGVLGFSKKLSLGSSSLLPSAVVCHPHPLMGGAMDNAVVVAVCRALTERGWAALRFNFRGAGGSDGDFDEGRGEMEDVAGAVDFLCERAEVDAGRLAVVGYSFGAEVGLRHAARDPRVNWLAGIALIQRFYDDPFLDDDPRPKLFVAGERDSWAPAEPLREYVARLRPPKSLHLIPRVGHSLAGREGDVAALVADFLTSSPLGAGTAPLR